MEVTAGQNMAAMLDVWSRMYRTVSYFQDPEKSASLALPAAVSSEMARLVTLEMQSEISGSARAEFLNMAYQRMLDKLRSQVEYGCALGGLILKPYSTADKRIVVDFVQADSFLPHSFDSSGRMTGVTFVDQLRRGDKIFTRFERHDLQDGIWTVQNLAFVSSNDQNVGREIALTEVSEWAHLSPEERTAGISQPMYGYFRVPMANTIDPKSPLGVSVFSRAVNLIHQADDMWAKILWEFESKETAVDMAESMFRRDEQGNPILPKGKDRLFRTHEVNLGALEKPFYNVFSPEIRDSSFFNGLNRILQRIEFNCGLAYGTLSDPQVVEKTAEEIKSSRQRSYATVSDIQKALQTALEDLVYAMDIWASLYELAPEGEYEMGFTFDDSLIVDSGKDQAVMMTEVAGGLLRPEIYLMKRYGVTEDQAKEMMPRSEEIPPNDEPAEE